MKSEIRFKDREHLAFYNIGDETYLLIKQSSIMNTILQIYIFLPSANTSRL